MNLRLLFFTLFISCNTIQRCSEFDQAIVYIESSLVSDMFYHLSWEPRNDDLDFISSLKDQGVVIEENVSKDSIPEPLIWYMEQKLVIGNRITDLREIKLPNQTVDLNRANYLLFASNIEGGKLEIKLLYNRKGNSILLDQNSSYEQISQMNGGMVYVFQFDKTGCLQEISKDFEFYD